MGAARAARGPHSFGSVRDASDPPSWPGRGVSGRAPDVASGGPSPTKLQERECLGVLCNIIAAPAPRASMDRVQSAALPSLGSGSALGRTVMSVKHTQCAAHRRREAMAGPHMSCG